MIRMMNLVVLVAMVLGVQIVGWSEVEGDFDLLREAIALREANRAKIKTWMGSAVTVNRMLDEGEIKEIRSAFVYAADEGAGFKRWKKLKDSQEMLPVEALLEMREQGEDWMIAPDGFYVMQEGIRNRDGTSQNTLVIWSLKQVRGRTSQFISFDPYWYFNEGGPGDVENLKRYYEDVSRWEGRIHIKVEREGDIVTFAMSDAQYTKVVRFDMAKGGNVVEVKTVGAGRMWRDVLDYQKVGDVWVPLMYEHAQNSMIESKRRSLMQFRVKFGEQKVNEAIDPEVFTVDAMGAMYAGQWNDWRTGEWREIKYGEEQIEGVLYQGDVKEEVAE